MVAAHTRPDRMPLGSSFRQRPVRGESAGTCSALRGEESSFNTQCEALKTGFVSNDTNLSVYLDACSDVLPPLRSRGGLGWGASAASGKSPTLPHGVLLPEAMATFGCTLKHKQPHPSPPLLSQGRGQIAASHGAMTLKLVPLGFVSSGLLSGLDSSPLKAEHVPVLSPRTGLRRNDERDARHLRSEQR